MASFKLLNYAGTGGEARAGILVAGERVLDLREALPTEAWAISTLSVLNAWDSALPVLRSLAANPVGALRPLTSVRLRAPLLYPPAIYCTGANYKAHAKEMNAED